MSIICHFKLLAPLEYIKTHEKSDLVGIFSLMKKRRKSTIYRQNFSVENSKI